MKKSEKKLEKELKERRKVVVVLGPTSSGKSELAVNLALSFNGEVVSADSRQVYRYLNIGTGKITKEEMGGIPHHLLDVVNPKNKFTVAEYQKKAISAIADIVSRGKIPIICGGTGFYIDSITKGIIFPKVPPNLKLRKSLYSKSAIALFEYLKKIDPRRAKSIDSKNKVRLIRAIEIMKALGKVPELKYDTFSAMAESVSSYKFIKIGLYLPPDKLKKKIEKRLLARMKTGMLREAKKLHRGGLPWKRMEELGLEYRYIALYWQNKITKKEMLEKLNSEIYQYAKRQMTWFKRDKEIKWFDASKKINYGILIRL